MPWRMRRLLGAAALLAGLGACGVTEDEAVRLREGQTLGDPGIGLIGCTSYGCPYEGQVCMEVFFEYGRSPPVCVSLDVCNRLECLKEGQRCALFDGFPGQIKCMTPED